MTNGINHRNDLYFQIIPVCYIHLSYSLYLPPDKCFLHRFALSIHIVLKRILQVLFILLPYIFRSDNPHPGADTGNPAKKL
mgnify:CR=1 FL=1